MSHHRTRSREAGLGATKTRRDPPPREGTHPRPSQGKGTQHRKEGASETPARRGRDRELVQCPLGIPPPPPLRWHQQEPTTSNWVNTKPSLQPNLLTAGPADTAHVDVGAGAASRRDGALGKHQGKLVVGQSQAPLLQLSVQPRWQSCIPQPGKGGAAHLGRAGCG